MKPLLVGDGIYKAIYDEFQYGSFWLTCKDFLKNKEIKTVIDIGASTGLSALMFLDYPEVEKIICFEPDNNNFSCLLVNIEPYMGKIEPHCLGIYYGKTESDVYGVGDNNPLGYFIEDVAENNLGDYYKNSAVKYDGKKFILSELENFIKIPADLIKIDVEGSEYNIISNSDIVKTSRFLIISFHNYPFEYVINYIKEKLPDYDVRFTSNLYNNSDILLERQ
jgi:FkbM family methyltransferase